MARPWARCSLVMVVLVSREHVSVRPGDDILVPPDTAQVHLFDEASGMHCERDAALG